MVAWIKNFYHRHEHALWLAMLVGGFIFDAFTFTRIDVLLDNLVLVSYLGICAAAIALMYAGNVSRLHRILAPSVATFAPLALRFTFGGLFSRFILFYSRSGSIFTSWPFLIMLVVLFFGNEFFDRKYLRINFELTIFFIALFSYFTFTVPVLARDVGPVMFLIAGLASVFALFLFTRVLRLIAAAPLDAHRTLTAATIVSVFVAFNVMYFANIIPPIPLSLKAGGIYYSVVRSGSAFLVETEQLPWYLFFLPYNRTIHWQPGTRLYAFTGVFAPARIESSIFHRWEYYDEGKGQWMTASELDFSITGGREGGYRIYSFHRGLFAGKWRVDVMTDRGQLLGRLPFTVIETDKKLPLEVIER